MTFNRMHPGAVLLLHVCSLPIVLSGCATSAPDPRPVACSPAPPASLHNLVSDAQAFLAEPGCSTRFRDYLALALQRAEASPDPANRARFAELLNTSAQRGIVSAFEAQQFYNRYFHTTFVSLPDDYNVCSTVRNKEPLLQGLTTELADKRRGMLTAAADREGFQDAQRQFNELVLVLEATALACRDT